MRRAGRGRPAPRPGALAQLRAMRSIVARSNRSVLYSQDAPKPLVQLGEGEQHIELGGAALDLDRAQGQAGQRCARHGQVLQAKRSLEERACGSGRGAGCEQRPPASRTARPGARRRPARSRATRRSSSRKVGLAVEPRAKDQRVDEEADQAFHLGAVAVGDGRADRDILLAGVAGKQRLKRGQQGHEQGGALLLAERFRPCCSCR